MAHVLIPIPAQDVDPTEVAVSWEILTLHGHHVTFATPDGRAGAADDIMISGRGLDPWGAIPVLRRLSVIGRIVRADASARAAYTKMLSDAAYATPLTWDEATLDGVDGLLLPGGHRARGMRPYLESARLQDLVVGAFDHDLPVAAICHGVLLAARSTNPATGHSVLHGRRTTALTWALERRAWHLGHVDSGISYYRTYEETPGQVIGHMSVQSEVTRNLANREDFLDVPTTDPDYRIKTDGRHRDTPTNPGPAFVVQDGNYLSARWPGDAHTFAARFASHLTSHSAGTPR